MRLARILASSLTSSLALSSSSSTITSLHNDLSRLAHLADIAYCVGTTGITKPFHCLSHCPLFPSLTLLTTWHTGPLLIDTCGYAALNPSAPEILVVFRGTYSLANTVMDLSSLPQPYQPYPSPPPPGRQHPDCANCSVHAGFFRSWESARPVVLPSITAAREGIPGATVHLVGHSLGGAVACLAALELKATLGWPDVRVTTFGEPRVGNEALSHYINTIFHLDPPPTPDPQSWSYRRVTHTNDPVPLLPWSQWGYASHAGEVFISKTALPPSPHDIRPCAGDADADCSAGAPRRPLRLAPWSPLFAHRDYFHRLGLCVPGGDPANWGDSVGEL
ncbi:hypothetical protein CDD80_4549 [Ophiocordyceps camponoti-rufipedis]|uniref:Fungal lipase-type domain-containing protein n=1 Tax=Ophiocordyceps camponoti-rufipedis TaxID=2004952 RepID=A0A2C5YSB5_9HYPO|nr:hypothetical protein CDD80_4549 [Ophiocordyceps camponoti-rufipedis]